LERGEKEGKRRGGMEGVWQRRKVGEGRNERVKKRNGWRE
jgi:hypothetical protein